MKVVLFCGGLGTRIRDDSESIPKPMVLIGYRPILWHVMKYYAHFGHKDFILCCGYRADVVKSYFLNYNEWLTNDFVIRDGARKIELARSDIQDWSIACVDTGINANIGQRLKAVEKYLDGEEEFLANYSDGLCDLDLPKQLEAFHQQQKVASFITVKPTASFHLVFAGQDNLITGITELGQSELRINGGFFIFNRAIFDYIRPGEDLINEPFQRLIRDREMLAYPYDGFWACMDTFKDRQRLESMYNKGEAPWEVWKRPPAPPARESVMTKCG